MWFLVDLLNLFVYVPFLKPTEEEVIKNINELKKQKWFRDLYQNERTVDLIIHNANVRQAIGRLHTQKISKENYQIHYQKKLHAILQKELVA